MEQIPYLTIEQMREVDRLMVEDYGVQLIQMMENAGRHLANLARSRFLSGDPQGKKVAILAGSGGNGGGALVSARHLANWGAFPKVILTKPLSKLREVTKIQAKILTQMGFELGSTANLEDISGVDLVVDGVIGYSLSGPPRGAAAAMISWANQQSAPVLALDLPSGLQASSGEIYEPTIRAAATLTLALPKVGLKIAPSEIVGDLYLADIGVPPDLYSRLTLEFKLGNIFANDGIISLA